MICPRADCDLNRCINGINATIANDAREKGFKFSAVMSFGKACGTCGQMRYWLRLADGSVREQKSADAA
jgi:hypothetical protein